jgi:hypothetical protein
MKPSVATFEYPGHMGSRRDEIMSTSDITEVVDKFKHNFEELCFTYGLNITSILCLVNAWTHIFESKTDHLPASTREKFWGLDRDFTVWKQNYYHIFTGAIRSYRLHLERQKLTPKFSWLPTLDYTQEISTDAFRELLSTAAREEVEKTNADYYETVERLRPELIQAILEYEAAERKGFAVNDGKRRYSLIEMFLNSAQFCPANLEVRILGIKPEDRTAVLNNDVLTLLF